MNMTFQELGLIPPILGALADMGYEHPSPIQERAIPPALQGRDVLGCAQTGTGKTCAFATPILQRFAARPAAGRPIRALILTPTRELALQIQENFAAYGKNLPLRSAVIFGGVGQAPQVDALKRGVDILVATPGRLSDLYQQGFIDLHALEVFVLDEADRMLDMGFIHDVKKILKWLPAKKQTLFFSATMPPEITELVNSLLHDPVKVAVNPVSSPVEVIDQKLYYVDRGNKSRLLALLMEELAVKNALVFTRTKHGANKVAGELNKAGISAAAIHGNKSQTARQQALADFKAGRVRALVATDIAARGLDIEELSHVFNYNLPDVPETYVHRIGRTGRAGRGGTAVSFCDINEKDELKAIEKLLKRAIPVVEGHPWPMVVLEPLKKDSKGRLINPEDAEARSAARERKAQRLAARQGQSGRAAAAAPPAPPQAEPSAAEPEATLPKKSRRKKKKAAAAVPEAPAAVAAPKTYAQTLRERQAQRPQAEEPFVPTSRDTTRFTRGVRQSLTLEEALAATAPHYTEEELAAQRSERRRFNPLGGDTIMDATARLLSSVHSGPKADSAPRQDRRAPAKTEPAEERPAGAGRRKRRTSSPSKEAAPQTVKKREKPQKGSPNPPRKGGEKQPAAPAEKPSAAKGRGGKRLRRDRPEPPRRSGALKDSTEQPSLMKPYYLSDD